jgi:hypothetical protein
MASKRRGRLAFGLGALGVGWAMLLVPAAFVVPAYSGSECSSAGCVDTSATLFGVNGWWVVELLAGVLLVAAVTLVVLHVRCATGSRAAGTLAWLAIASLGFFSLLSSASIGLFVFPTVALLIASTAVMPRQPPRAHLRM